MSLRSTGVAPLHRYSKPGGGDSIRIDAVLHEKGSHSIRAPQRKRLVARVTAIAVGVTMNRQQVPRGSRVSANSRSLVVSFSAYSPESNSVELERM